MTLITNQINQKSWLFFVSYKSQMFQHVKKHLLASSSFKPLLVSSVLMLCSMTVIAVKICLVQQIIKGLGAWTDYNSILYTIYVFWLLIYVPYIFRIWTVMVLYSLSLWYLLHHSFAQTSHIGYLLLSSASLAFRAPCECWILKSSFSHYVSQIFHLFLSDCYLQFIYSFYSPLKMNLLHALAMVFSTFIGRTT